MPSHNKTQRRAVAIALAAGMALSGCAHTGATLHAAAMVQNHPLKPLVVTGAPARIAGTVDSSPGDNRFMFRDTPLGDALRLLFAGSGVNLILADDLDGTVTADFVGLPPEQVLSTLLTSHGLMVRYRDGTAHVGPEGSRTFTLNYVAGDEHKALWEDVDKQISALLSADGKLTVSPLTGTLIVSDRPSVLDRVDVHLEKLEEIIRRQVLLEAKIIEVTLNDDFEMGIDYGLFPRTFGIGGAVTGTAAAGAAISQSLAPQSGNFSLGILRANDFSALLTAINTQGKANILSSPKVSTLNNRPAIINVTEQVPVVSREVITGDVDAQTRELYTVEFEKAGIQLEVTPQIGADGTMTIRVHPLITEVTDSITTPDGLQTLPIINQRETESVLTVSDGETVLMGGFIQNRMREEVTQVPLLGDLPFIGPLFRRTIQNKDRVELVILLTPRVMDPARMADAVSNAVDGVQQLVRPFSFGILQDEAFTPRIGPIESGYKVTSQMEPTRIGDGGFAPVSRPGLARQALDNGLSQLAKGDLSKAEAAFNTALEINAGDTEAHFQLAIIHAGRGHASKAMRHFEHIANVQLDHPWGLNRLALALTRAAAFEPATRVLRHGLMRFPDHPALLTNLGVAYLGKGVPELAETAFRRVARMHPDAVEAQVNRAELYAADGFTAEAAELLEAALPKVTGNPEFYLRIKRRLHELTPPQVEVSANGHTGNG
jgi:MSHA type pilus biogenesis protein MshL